MSFIEEIRRKASGLKRRIVFPEGNEVRVLQAADFLQRNGLARCVLLGREREIAEIADQNRIQLKDMEVIDPLHSPLLERYALTYYDLRKEKGVSFEESAKIISDPIYFGAMMVRTAACDGSVAGSVHTTGDVLRAAIQIIGTAPGISLVSSTFEMVLQDGRVLTFADCAVVPDPDAEQLADIAISSAETHRQLTGEAPRVALLSFSTKGSAEHPSVEKVRQALEIVRRKRRDLAVDGELQGDAALSETVGQRKAPGSPVAGQANVLV
ncbi:MAG: phosphate acetyltransferase, partial [Calditrichaeota bacterium]